MKQGYFYLTFVRIRAIAGAMLIAPMAMSEGYPIWSTVVNNDDLAPHSAQQHFFSYNPPSVNAQGIVVFRARAKNSNSGGENGPAPADSDQANPPVHGIFSRNMQDLTDIVTLASNQSPNDVLPEPNNITHPGPATFNEFPSFPRLDKFEPIAAFRGQSTPSWEVQTGGETEKSGGTSGVYTGFIDHLKTAIRNIEAPFFPEYLVPDSALPQGAFETHFEQFPGAPSPSVNLVAFKGNYSIDDVPYTGVFYRKVPGQSEVNTVQMIANSATTCIPDTQPCVKFGSTAPPSAVGKKMVFLGLNDEAHPEWGGIYLAEMKEKNPNDSERLLKPLVEINKTPVPDTDGNPVNESAVLTRLGESISFDGQYLAFWGAWGDEFKTVKMVCPDEGNRVLIAYCKENQDNKNVEVPVNQGIFVLNTNNGVLKMAAQTHSRDDDFLYWNFSGRPPGMVNDHEGDDMTEDFEEPRWRSNAFLAVDGSRVAFKARAGYLDESSGLWDDSTIDGIYLKNTQDNQVAITLVNTLTPGNQLDPSAPAETIVATLGIERDGYRKGWLVINASMTAPESDAHEENSWAGIYLIRP